MSKQFNKRPDRPATIVVHPTAGVGDATTIADGLAMLPTAGGSILLREGTYSLTTTVTLPDKPVTIYGCGDNTIISLGANAIPAFTIPNGLTTDRSFVFEDLLVTGTSVASQKIWSIEDSNSRGALFGTRINSTGIQFPVHVTAGGSVPVPVNLDDCHFALLVDGSSILIHTVATPSFTTDAQLQRVHFYTVYGDDIPGTLTIGGPGIYDDFSNVNIMGEDNVFSLGTTCTVGALAVTNTAFLNFSPNPNPVVCVADDAYGVILSFIDGCRSEFVDFNFAGNGTRAKGCTFSRSAVTDGAISFFTDCYFTGSGPTTALSCSSSTSVKGCVFDGSPLDFYIDGRFYSVIGNWFAIGATNAIRITNGAAIITGNIFNTNAQDPIVEVGSSFNKISDNYQLTTPSTGFLADSNAVINGVRRHNETGTSTTDAYVVLMAHSGPKGLAGSGSIKNVGVTNTLTIKLKGTDSYGTVDEQTYDVLPTASLNWSVDDPLGTSLPPFVLYQIEVKSTVPGNPTTYDLRHASVGAE